MFTVSDELFARLWVEWMDDETETGTRYSLADVIGKPSRKRHHFLLYGLLSLELILRGSAPGKRTLSIVRVFPC